MKKALSLLLALLLLAALSACGQKDPAGSTDDPGQEGGGEALAAYQAALQDFAYQHRLPDGTEFEIPTGFGSVENNRFAVCDMNGDGREELLIHFTTAPTAGMAEWVFSYAGGGLTEELRLTPGAAYYDNGAVIAPWSHNQTCGPADFWPYALLMRNAAGGYDTVAQVSAWDKTVYALGDFGTPFPEEKDDGSGVVYLVTEAGQEQILSGEEYAAWYGEKMGDARAYDIPWQDMTESNIRGLLAP